MPLHRMIVDAIASASACSLWSTPKVPVELDAAARADNTASAVAQLRHVEAGLFECLHRVQTARQLCEAALKDDEEAPAAAPVRARPSLRVVG